MTAEIKLINQTDGLPGLWWGLYPSLCRTVPGVGLYFASMHWMRNTVCEGKPSALQSMMIGCTARTFAGSVMIPFTVVKTRMESGTYQYRSVTAAITHILRNEGVRGLARGLGPTLVRDVPFSGLYLAFYDVLKSKCPAWLSSSSPECAHMMAGLSRAVKTLYSEAGITAFTAGLAPRMLRRTVMAALAWTVYERINTTLSLK